ncbi:MAG: hypothetical protein JRH06_14840 [Deltaproteobacteria bacterium]|nr:hypothetical protein [Deltaproteobacteria bacterium]MBW2138812.1 hypothetical protein [Deltaproteobacteria bacterium]
MGLPRFTHIKASGLEEALEILREKGEEARIAVAGVTSYPVRAVEAEGVMKGQKPTEALMEEVAELVIKAASPISSIWVSANQRRRTLRVLVKRGIKEAVRQRRGE